MIFMLLITTGSSSRDPVQRSLCELPFVITRMTTGEKATVWIIAGVIVLGIFGYTFYRSYVANKAAEQEANNILGSSTSTPQLSAEELAVRSQVLDFGKQLQKVPLLGEKALVAQAMDSNYGPYVDAALLASWKTSPMDAPGRLTSSPWPDRIEITSAQKNTDGTYTVSGEIVAITSAGVSKRTPVSLTLANQNGNWIIIRFEAFSDKG